ncbi:hypothetical protein L1286_23920 [Pseudoalteromonas sp. SMS1]|uniref:hypothetical protein n=1 Tax=Pseudoalteromonas sp. SMS1 TaxID=2908894 RepID=UPI001F163DAE|nr:hypothetical protein [Pseudoalteromonas sp. SMS1]MCF2860514.1 hypothetical protein [Pseudoalteromonas sp. SMS1]
MALPSIKKSHSDPFGGFLDSTPHNPYGLSQAQRSKVNYLASNPLINAETYNELSFYEQQHYEIARDKHIMSLAGPQLVASNADFEASQRQLAAKQKAYFGGQRWDQRAAQGMTDSAIISRWGKVAVLGSGITIANLKQLKMGQAQIYCLN